MLAIGYTSISAWTRGLLRLPVRRVVVSDTPLLMSPLVRVSWSLLIFTLWLPLVIYPMVTQTLLMVRGNCVLGEGAQPMKIVV